ncbi:MAG TPA: carbohydrate kinase family protein [Coriobacteriia bacterium]|nr:carbohydrate kinase family protein [Coriobacteriia bacterium]
MSLSLASARVTVLGGANTDIVGHSAAPLVAFDSNPGEVRMSPGGVGRNIAENLARLGVRTTLLTGFGSDAHGRELERACRAARIDTAPSLVCGDLAGSVYLAILDDEGDMALAVSDMRPLDRLTPRVLQARRGALESSDLVVADTNLPEETLEWLAEATSVPIALDLVSTTKAPRARTLLAKLAIVKGNGLEAAALLGQPDPETRSQIETLAHRLLERGAGTAFVTAGALGSCYADATETGWMDAPQVDIANATGAGDAFTAGVVAARLADRPLAECARFGSHLAGVTLGSHSTVSEHVGAGALQEAIKEWEQQ